MLYVQFSHLKNGERPKDLATTVDSLDAPLASLQEGPKALKIP